MRFFWISCFLAWLNIFSPRRICQSVLLQKPATKGAVVRTVTVDLALISARMDAKAAVMPKQSAASMHR